MGGALVALGRRGYVAFLPWCDGKGPGWREGSGGLQCVVTVSGDRTEVGVSPFSLSFSGLLRVGEIRRRSSEL